MEPLKALEEFGLTTNEALVYLALLQLGTSPVLSIARRAGLKRPTVYLILDELMRRGLTALAPHEKKKLYLALPPERLLEEVERKHTLIRGALPELTALYRTQTARPSIQVFESREGIMNVYREITSPQKEEVLTFFSIEAIPKEFQESYELFIEALKQKKIKSRDIAYTKDKKHFYIHRTKGLPNYELRFATAPHQFFTDNIIYGNKVALFSFQKRFVVVIESEDVARSFRSLFELAWNSAEQ